MYSLRHSRRVTALTVSTAAASLLLAGLALSPASADPDPSNPGTFPATIAGSAPTDPGVLYAGVGADADGELLDNVATQYDTQFTNTNPPTATTPYLESFDATNPSTGATGESIVTKPGCTGFARPTGTGDGLTAVNNAALVSSAGTGSKPCVNFARSSSARTAAQAADTFWELGQDAVDWVAVGGSYAPTTSLSDLQIKEIFTCQITNWDEVGGQNGAIHVYVNPSTAATYKFFLTAIGITDSSSICANATTVQQVNGTLLKGDPQAIAPYAVSKWAGQANAQAPFVDNRGGTDLGQIGGSISPTTTSAVNSTNYLTLNPDFAGEGSQGRILYNVTRTADGVGTGSVANSLFGTSGYICSNQNALLIPYGVPPLPDNACGQQAT